MDENLTYSDAIEQVLRDNNYVASLQTIYREINKYRKLTGKTPFNTIQERVQRDPRFTKLEKGVYALTEFLTHLPPSLSKPHTQTERKERIHFRIQGMLLEIGNLLQYKTYTANKGAEFAGKRLDSYATLGELPRFTYDSIVAKARHIDVVWFTSQEEGFPTVVYEIDTSPAFHRSLLKFTDLYHFNARFRLVSSHAHQQQFRDEMKREIFQGIRGQTKFLTYEIVEEMYESSLKQSNALVRFL